MAEMRYDSYFFWKDKKDCGDVPIISKIYFSYKRHSGFTNLSQGSWVVTVGCFVRNPKHTNSFQRVLEKTHLSARTCSLLKGKPAPSCFSRLFLRHMLCRGRCKEQRRTQTKRSDERVEAYRSSCILPSFPRAQDKALISEFLKMSQKMHIPQRFV